MSRLILELRHPHPENRWRAACELGESPEPGAVEALCEALRDADGRVRRHAAATLGKLGDPAAVEPLVGLLQDPVESVREQAAVSLGLLGDRRAVSGLHRALDDPEGWVRSRAAEALGRIGDAGSWFRLTAALQDPDRWVQARAAGALERLNDPRAAPALAEALARPGCHSWVAAALGRLGGSGAVPVLVAALERGDPAMRLQCVRALGEGLTRGTDATKGPENPAAREAGVSVLIRGLSDSDPYVRMAAASSLERIARWGPAPGLRAAVPILRRLLQPWSAEGEEARPLHLAALRAIEAATGACSRFPLPARPPLPAPHLWPRPVAPPSSSSPSSPLATQFSERAVETPAARRAAPALWQRVLHAVLRCARRARARF